jgi:hypothetical protein
MTPSRRARPPVGTFQTDYLDLVLQEQNERDKRERQTPTAELDELMGWPSFAEFRLLVQPRTSENPN